MITDERQHEAKATTIQVVYYDQINNIDFVSGRRSRRGGRGVTGTVNGYNLRGVPRLDSCSFAMNGESAEQMLDGH